MFILCVPPARSGCEKIWRQVFQLQYPDIDIIAVERLKMIDIEVSRGGEMLTVCGKFDMGTGGMRIVPHLDYSEAPLILRGHDDGRISGLQLNRRHNRKKSKRR